MEDLEKSWFALPLEGAAYSLVLFAVPQGSRVDADDEVLMIQTTITKVAVSEFKGAKMYRARNFLAFILEGDPVGHTEAAARVADRVLHATASNQRSHEAGIPVLVGVAHTGVSKTRSPAVLLHDAMYEQALVSPAYDHRYMEWARDHIAFVEAMSASPQARERLTADYQLMVDARGGLGGRERTPRHGIES